MRSPSIVILAIAAAASIQTQAQNNALYIVAETQRGYASLQDAINAIGAGNGTIMIGPGVYKECGVQEQGQISYRATVAGQTIFDGVACEGKAALVLRGRGASVDGIVFENMTVHDANGAGIRLEKGNLKVTRSIFRNSEQGILTANDPASSIIIDQTTFSRLGRCDRGLSCAHSIYIGNYGSLTVTRTRFEKGNGGHYVKSRAARATITGNAFDDTQGRTTNYMIDLPAGASGLVNKNMFVQGKNKENYSAFIAVAAEDKLHSSNGLSIRNNEAKIAPGVDRNTTFLADWSGDGIRLGANRLGRGLKPFERR